MLSRTAQSFALASKRSAFAPTSRLPFQAAAFSVCAAAFPAEPAAPEINTAFPSPKTIEWKESMQKTSCTLATHFPVDLTNSCGNYV